ncbi:hypothetical protein [Streptomyces lanatus]|uniref:Uncharacterized protein n=1 Tax=Streptomyces lanatus TaxID=66900 RepID=A0ABV1XHS6_9ACTN|nr:hypothetical protein [Streptomyces lanatus]GHG94215.1 hypothetical protein GCM10018780_17310 [Streptomyces lanatus]
MTRRIATGCLVLLMIPAAVVVYFWYTVWHAGHVNDERRRDAVASILRHAREVEGDTRRALDRSGSAAGVDALTGVIWRHSEAPLIAYDPAHRTFTATVSEAAFYDQEAVLLGGGPSQVTRCLHLTFAHGTGSAWTSAVAVRDEEGCRASRSIGSWASLAQDRIGNMYARDLTLAGVRRALDPTGRLGYYDVRTATREGRHSTITVLIRDARLTDTAAQCYRFVRKLDSGSVTALPLTACPAAHR